jgi:hypothetical protein
LLFGESLKNRLDDFLNLDDVHNFDLSDPSPISENLKTQFLDNFVRNRGGYSEEPILDGNATNHKEKSEEPLPGASGASA